MIEKLLCYMFVLWRHETLRRFCLTGLVAMSQQINVVYILARKKREVYGRSLQVNIVCVCACVCICACVCLLVV